MTGSDRPGRSIFTIEGRAAPGLFVVGWLATLAGLGAIVVGLLAGGDPSVVLFLVGAILLSLGLIAGAGVQSIERRTRGTAAYQGPSPLLLFATTIPVTYLAAVAVGGPLAAIGATLPRPVAELILVAVQAAVYLGLVRLLVVGAGALSWAEMGFAGSARIAASQLAWGAVFAGPVILVTALLASGLAAVFQAVPESPLPATGSTGGLVLHLVAGAAIAPFGEEILFRGVATTAWARTLGVGQGIVRAALLFAAAHVLTILIGGSDLRTTLALSFVAFVGRIPVALALGWVYVRRGSIWASIGLHGAFNAVLIVLAEMAVRAPG